MISVEKWIIKQLPSFLRVNVDNWNFLSIYEISRKDKKQSKNLESRILYKHFDSNEILYSEKNLRNVVKTLAVYLEICVNSARAT